MFFIKPDIEVPIWLNVLEIADPAVLSHGKTLSASQFHPILTLSINLLQRSVIVEITDAFLTESTTDLTPF